METVVFYQICNPNLKLLHRSFIRLCMEGVRDLFFWFNLVPSIPGSLYATLLVSTSCLSFLAGWFPYVLLC